MAELVKDPQDQQKEVEREEKLEPVTHPAVVGLGLPMNTNMYRGTAHGEPVGPMNQGTGLMGVGDNNSYPLNLGDVTAFRTADSVDNDDHGVLVGKNKETTKLYFPHPVSLAGSDGHVMQFKAGEQDVPTEYADHPYLAAHGVRRGKEQNAAQVGSKDAARQEQDVQKLQDDNVKKSQQQQAPGNNTPGGKK